MATSENSLIAARPFKRDGFVFSAGDEVDIHKAGFHRFLFSALVRDRKLTYGPIVRPWAEHMGGKLTKEVPETTEDEVPVENSPNTQEEAVVGARSTTEDDKPKAIIKRKGGGYYDIFVGGKKLNTKSLRKDEATKVKETYNGNIV